MDSEAVEESPPASVHQFLGTFADLEKSAEFGFAPPTATANSKKDFYVAFSCLREVVHRALIDETQY